MLTGYQIRGINTSNGRKFDFGQPHENLQDAIDDIVNWKNNELINSSTNTFTQGEYTFTWTELKIFYRSGGKVDESIVFHTDS